MLDTIRSLSELTPWLAGLIVVLGSFYLIAKMMLRETAKIAEGFQTETAKIAAGFQGTMVSMMVDFKSTVEKMQEYNLIQHKEKGIMFDRTITRVSDNNKIVVTKSAQIVSDVKQIVSDNKRSVELATQRHR